MFFKDLLKIDKRKIDRIERLERQKMICKGKGIGYKETDAGGLYFRSASDKYKQRICGISPDKALIKAFAGRREELKEGNLGAF